MERSCDAPFFVMRANRAEFLSRLAAELPKELTLEKHLCKPLSINSNVMNHESQDEVISEASGISMNERRTIQ